MSLKGKVAIVTGSASGIGQEIALTLAERGVKVLVTDIRDNADETLSMIEAAGGTACYMQGDIREEKTHEDMFALCTEKFGIPDLFIANAGLNGMVMLKDTTVEDYHKFFDTNVKGTYLGIKEAQKVMQSGGKIIVISSTSINYPVPGMVLYAGTKSAVHAMVDVAAIELAEKGITINSILPGVTATKEALINIPQSHLDNVKNTTPLGRMGTPRDIAKVVAMMCSEDSDWLTGQHIEANGGAAF